jgi:acyl dehydratase
MLRLDTTDARGELVSRTWQLGISRGVDLLGDPRAVESPPALPEPRGGVGEQRRYPLAVAEGLAHVYTECARIWNPIHTDRAVALAAGLPDIILHGTATLALAVSRLVNELLGGDPARVRRIGGRFSAMVPMPTTLMLEVVDQGGAAFFRVLTADGAAAVDRGFLLYH